MADISVLEPDEDTLVRRRSRRSTAGNRMEAAMAEMLALNPEPEAEEEDKDFNGPAADEEEIFDSDFASTDEEQEADDVGEQAIVAEEKEARRQSRRRPTKSALSQPIKRAVNGESPKNKRRLRISVNFTKETKHGSSSTPIAGPSSASARSSLRRSTIQSSQTLQSRLQEAESKRLSLPKRRKEQEVVYTQAELLARALDNEEENIASHKGYLAAEEEKRRRVKVVRKGIHGPLLRWVSRAEEEEVEVAFAYENKPPRSAPSMTTASGLPVLPLSNSANPIAANPPAKQKVKVTKNYVVHELGQYEGVPKPDWTRHMRALFGDHINWDELKVYLGRHRPSGRPVARCPITGLPATYRDPRSGVPYANLEAFRILSQILEHEFVWSEDLRCYTANEKSAQIMDEEEEEDEPAHPAAHSTEPIPLPS